MTDEDISNLCLDLARIWNVNSGEIAKMIHDYIERDISKFKPLQLYPKPNVSIKPVKIKTLKERLEGIL